MAVTIDPKFLAAELIEQRCAKNTGTNGSPTKGGGDQSPCPSPGVMQIEVRNSITGTLLTSAFYCEQHAHSRLRGLVHGALQRPVSVTFRRWAPTSTGTR